jgi:RNase P subunit RPR2
MTQDTERQSFRGVVCLHCKQPIPISALVTGIEAELRADETTPPRHQKCQVFHLRCAACGKEKPYKIGEILEFETAPATGTPRAEPASAYLRQMDSRSRAANG